VTLSDLSTERGEAHHEWIGDVQVAQADGPRALAAYQAGLAIREGLARRDPANTQWQVDVAVSCSKLGSLDSLLLIQATRSGGRYSFQ